jgi:hypothetical protein
VLVISNERWWASWVENKIYLCLWCHKTVQDVHLWTFWMTNDCDVYELLRILFQLEDI